MERPTCKTCPYFRKDDGHTESVRQHLLTTSEAGDCRRNAPTSGTRIDAVKIFESPDAWIDTDSCCGELKVGNWFLVTIDDWCGEHPDFPAYIASLKAPVTQNP